MRPVDDIEKLEHTCASELLLDQLAAQRYNHADTGANALRLEPQRDRQKSNCGCHPVFTSAVAAMCLGPLPPSPGFGRSKRWLQLVGELLEDQVPECSRGVPKSLGSTGDCSSRRFGGPRLGGHWHFWWKKAGTMRPMLRVAAAALILATATAELPCLHRTVSDPRSHAGQGHPDH